MLKTEVAESVKCNFCGKNLKQEKLIIIIGDKISSNSTRLYEVGKSLYPNRTVLQINSLEELTKFDVSKYKKGFITAGASTPDEVINPIIKYLQNY